jgi:hypothetical protein
MEDLVIYSRTYEEHVDLLRILFKTANDNNVSFNKKKTVYANTTAIFAGYEISAEGFRPNPNLHEPSGNSPGRPTSQTCLVRK